MPQMPEDRYPEVLAFIARTIDERGYPPSRREIAGHIGRAPSSTQAVIDNMVAKGLIEVDRSVPRGIRVVRMVAETEAMS